MKILAIGCSFTCGDELPDAPDPGSWWPTPVPSKYAWPAVLGNMLNAEVTNLGMPGSSNSRVFRLAITETAKEKYDLVICSWAELSRLDWANNGHSLQINYGGPLCFSEPIFNKYFKTYYDETLATETWLSQIIALQNHFTYTHQRYLFINSIITGYAMNRIITNFNSLCSLINTDYYVAYPNSMLKMVENCPKGPGGHPLELGHKRIAESVYEHIQNLGWL